MKQQDHRERRQNLLRLWPFLRPQWPTLLACCCMVLLVNAAELAKPYILGTVLDLYLTPEQAAGIQLRTVWMLALLYLGCAVVSSGLAILENIQAHQMGQNVLRELRRRVFSHIQHMSMRALDRFSSGRLITRATNDVETLNELFSDVLVNLFKDVFLLLGITTMMLVMNWRLALVAFAVVPPIALITLFVRSKLRQNFVILKSLIGRINGFVAENISGVHLVQIFRKERQKAAELEELNRTYYRHNRIQVQFNATAWPLVEFINTLGIALLVWYGCGRIQSGVLEIGVLYTFTNYIKQFFEPINDLAEKYTTISSAGVSAQRIFELLDDESQLEAFHGSTPLDTRPCGRIEFEHVWFAYKPGEWVLRDVSFTIEPGQSVAFVGATGAGKTTIISLLSRFYDADRGTIRLDGRDIRTLPLRELRSFLAVVLQDVFLFSGSIEENIRLGDQDIDRETVENALALSCASRFIEQLPGKMAYPVEERGATFSAGQRQLLSLARAIAHNPAVFVLDEATATIDMETEQLIQQSLRNISAHCTTILIAHRLSTIRACDRIYVMRAGQIAEQGTHEELLALGGIYSELCRVQ